MLAHIKSTFPFCLVHIHPYMECLNPCMDMWASMKFWPSEKYTVNQGCMSLSTQLSTHYLEYGRRVARLRRRRHRVYAPTCNTASHDNGTPLSVVAIRKYKIINLTRLMQLKFAKKFITPRLKLEILEADLT